MLRPTVSEADAGAALSASPAGSGRIRPKTAIDADEIDEPSASLQRNEINHYSYGYLKPFFGIDDVYLRGGYWISTAHWRNDECKWHS